MDSLAPHKRARPVSPTSTSQESLEGSSTRTTPVGNGAGTNSASSAFRNVSACNRCRLRKNKCDQKLPACSSCEKAGVKCVGYDPITKREIPRAYVYYLESRVSYLEDLLKTQEIPFASADDFDAGTRLLQDRSRSVSPGSPGADRARPTPPPRSGGGDRRQYEADRLENLVSNIGMVTVQGASDPRYLGSTSGISFARVVFAAVRSSISGSTSDRAGLRPGRPPQQVAVTGASSGNSTNFRDSFFGLQSKPNFKKAAFPDKELGAKLVKLYFEHSNPQIPILHRGEFMALFNRTYQTDEDKRSPRELYMLNIVFAIGAGTIMEDPKPVNDEEDEGEDEQASPKSKRFKSGISQGSKQAQPEQYHASAMVHLEYFLSSSPAAERPEGFGGTLEELQAVLLLASFALLRPVAPGLWYIIGVAMRLAVDLGLHHEDGSGVDEGGPPVRTANGHRPSIVDARERGRREWIRDLRRRLWWCVYSFDRLVSTCVGRPFGITDQVITTEFPSLLDDNYITTSGFTAGAGHDNEPSYKRVAHHYFRFRLLQSEILQVLQYRSTKHAREKGRNRHNQFMHTKLRSPFLEPHDNNFKRWRRDIDRRLLEWKESEPTQKETQVKHSVYFLDLNYYQAVIMLYRQSLHVPPELDGEISPSSEIESPLERPLEDEGDDDEVFMKVAEAGQKVLKLYMLLHKEHVVNYTFLATHHLFMAGIAFLYAIWHSAAVRSMLTIDDVDYTVLAGTTVLRGLVDKCPPAEACRDAFDRMAKATVHMVLSTTGFGLRPSSHHGNPQPHQYLDAAQYQSYMFQAQNAHGDFRPQRPRPQFDHTLRDLFPDDTPEIRGFRNLGRPSAGAALQNNSALHAAQVAAAQAAQASGGVPHSMPLQQSQGSMAPGAPLPQNIPQSLSQTMPPNLAQMQQNRSTPPNLGMPMAVSASSPSASLFPHSPGSPFPSPFANPHSHHHPPMGVAAPTSFPDGVGVGVGVGPGAMPNPLLRSGSPTAMSALSPAAMSSVSTSTLSTMSNAMSPARSNVSSSALGSSLHSHGHGAGTPTAMDPMASHPDGLDVMHAGMVPDVHGGPAGQGIPGYDALGFHNELDGLLGEHTAAYSGHGGLSLGFDTDHDWNDGWGPDFMDGYWFGGGLQGGQGHGPMEMGQDGT